MLAYDYAVQKGFRMTGGSDIHSLSQDDMGGMSFSNPIETIEDFVSAFMSGEGTPVFVQNVHNSEGHFAPITTKNELMIPSKEPTLEIILH